MAGGRKEYEMLIKLTAALSGNFSGTFQSAITKSKELQKSVTAINRVSGKIDGFNKQSSALQRSKARLSELTREHERLSEKMAATEQPSEALNKKMARNEQQISQVTDKIQEQERSLGRLGQQLSDAGLDTNNLEVENIKLAQSYERVRQAQEEYARVSAAYDQNRQAIVAARGELAMTVGAAAAVGVAIYAGPVKSAMEFESAMADVTKVVDGLRDASTSELTEDYAVMKKELLELSTVIPMTGKQLTEIAAAAGQAGIARSEITGFSTDAAKMGIAFDSTAEQAGEWMAKWRTSFGMNQVQVVELADKINYLGNTTAANAGQISTIVTKVGPLGEVAGFATGEIAALGTSLVAVGVQEDVAATGIKKLMTTMTAGSAVTERQATVLEKLGLDAEELAERMQVDAKGAVLDFMEAVRQLPEAEQTAALKNYFGEQAVAAIAPLLTQLELLEENFRKVGDASQYAGSMEMEYAARADTTENRVELLKNKMTALSVTLGEVFMPVASSVIDKVSGMVTEFTKWAKRNPETIKNVVKLAGQLLALKAGTQVVKLGFHELNGARLLVQKGIALFGTKTAEAGAAAATGMAGATTAGSGLTGMLGALASPAGIALAAIAALTVGVVAYIAAKEQARQAVLHFSDDLAKSAASFDTINSKANDTAALTQEYRNLEAVIADNKTTAEEAATAKERMKEIEDELIAQNPDVLSRYDAENGKLSENLDFLNEKLEKERELARMKVEEEQYETEKNLPAATQEYGELTTKSQELDAQYSKQQQVRNGLLELNQEWALFMATDPGESAISAKVDEITGKAEELGKITGEEWNFEGSGMAGVHAMWESYDKLTIKTGETREQVMADMATLEQSFQQYHDNVVKMAEEDLGGDFETKVQRLADLQYAYSQWEREGKTDTTQAQAIKAEMDELQPKLLEAATKIRDVGLAVGEIPEVKTIDVEGATSELRNFKTLLDNIPPTKMVQLIVQQNGGKVPGYATGGIITKPTLATFAEKGPEAAIPIENTTNSRALWVKTGQLIGMLKNTGTGMETANDMAAAATAQASAGTVAAFKPQSVSVEASSGRTGNVVLNDNSQWHVDGNVPGDFERLLAEHRMSIVQQVMDIQRNQKEDEVRLGYA